jgi:protein gp37
MQHTDICWCLNPDGTPGYSWNPVFGCRHWCPYCYGQRIANRFYKGDFSPRFYPERVTEPYRLKNPSMIFLGSMTDMFGAFVRHMWWDDILRVILDNPQHIFATLTKAPSRIGPYMPPGNPPPNLWLGTTVESEDEARRIAWVRNPYVSVKGVRFVSFEPLHGRFEWDLDLEGIDWVIIGQETGNRKGKIPAKKEWVIELASIATDYGIPVWMKDNLIPLMAKDELLREMPIDWRNWLKPVIKADDILDGRGEEELEAGELHAKDMVFSR